MAKGITAQEMDSVTASGLVPHLGTTTNSGNSYSVTSNTPISTNQKFTIKFNVASSTAPTLKINNDTALPIKKANGNNAKLYASVYTLFRDGSAFILQGEGGSGNVQPDQVEAGFTFTNDNGEFTGTLSKQAFVDAITSKGVTASMADPFNTLAAKIDQISTGLKRASGNGAPTGVEIVNLDFEPLIIIIRCNGSFYYNDGHQGNDNRSAQIGGAMYFVKGEHNYNISASVTTGRDGSTNIEINPTVSWYLNGFKINVQTRTSSSSNNISASIGNWVAIGI
ncbi:Phage-related putative tail protein [Paenibacillus vortex V453]|uniref:Phage-related putative tail protein n=1 Tax=Paenibacillus vortex V453 TaxID=715225 RepID=A0A2R9SMT8_9BACL|nr:MULTISPECIES: hypothetical protein [Paenibacillus]AWP25906.1 hypothetical protein B9D94_04405 [Paenibacillus sp. Cedars]EFU38669.1 Phage-related putative tail protein [Paenibacillus vortex V453]